MRRNLRWLGLVVALACVLPATAAENDKDKKEAAKKPADPKAQAADKKDPEKKPADDPKAKDAAADKEKKDPEKKPADPKAADKKDDKKPADPKAADKDKKPADPKKDEKKPADPKAADKKDDKKPADPKPGDDKDKKDPDKKPAPLDPKAKAAAAAAEKVVYGMQLTGKLASIESSQKTFSVQVTIPQVVPVRQGYRITVQVQRTTQNIELEAAEDMKVRMANPPMEYDEKGRPKRYTSKELKELKGSSALPGYPGDFENLKTNQVVQVYLAKPKTAPKPAARPKPGAEKEPLLEEKPKVVMVVVLYEDQRK